MFTKINYIQVKMFRINYLICSVQAKRGIIEKLMGFVAPSEKE